MLSKRSDVRTVMVEKGCKLMIIGQHEQVCDLPEYKHLCNTPEKAAYWNQRARGFGGDPEGSYSASCGEENVLCLEGDRYVGESILVHEFAHLIHDEGIAAIEPGSMPNWKRCIIRRSNRDSGKTRMPSAVPTNISPRAFNLFSTATVTRNSQMGCTMR